VSSPGGVLSSQMMQPIRIVDVIPTRAVTQPQPDVYVYDFGQNFAGFCRLRVRGPAGVAVKMRFAEILDHDGSGMIYTANLRSAKATDIYTLNGNVEGEEYIPRYVPEDDDYHDEQIHISWLSICRAHRIPWCS